jgi:hypothetical protein
MRRSETALVLGGAGLVGYQVALKLALEIHAQRIVIHSLYRSEVFDAVSNLSRSVPGVEFKGTYGNLFTRGRPPSVDEHAQERSPMEQIQDSEFLWESFADTFEDFETAYRESCLAQLLLSERPDVVVDSVNTATGISCQDIFTTSRNVGRELKEILRESPSKKMDQLP